MKAIIIFNASFLYRVILITPIALLGIYGLVILLVVVISGKSDIYEFVYTLGGLSVQWIWTSVPFLVLLKKQYNTLHIIGALLVYAIYACAIYFLVAYADENTAIADSFVMLVTPVVATVGVAIVLAIGRIINTAKHRRIKNS